MCCTCATTCHPRTIFFCRPPFRPPCRAPWDLFEIILPQKGEFYLLHLNSSSPFKLQRNSMPCSSNHKQIPFLHFMLTVGDILPHCYLLTLYLSLQVLGRWSSAQSVCVLIIFDPVLLESPLLALFQYIVGKVIKEILSYRALPLLHIYWVNILSQYFAIFHHQESFLLSKTY